MIIYGKSKNTHYGSSVHEAATEHGLDSFALGRGDARYVCVCSRQPTGGEMKELRAQDPTAQTKEQQQVNEPKLGDEQGSSRTIPPPTPEAKPAPKSGLFYLFIPPNFQY